MLNAMMHSTGESQFFVVFFSLNLFFCSWKYSIAIYSFRKLHATLHIKNKTKRKDRFENENTRAVNAQWLLFVLFMFHYSLAHLYYPTNKNTNGRFDVVFFFQTTSDHKKCPPNIKIVYAIMFFGCWLEKCDLFHAIEKLNCRTELKTWWKR